MIFTRVARPRHSTDRVSRGRLYAPMVLLMRFRVEPRDVPREAAARRIGLTLEQFDIQYANLVARGFPAFDPDTGHFDLHAIDRWCDARHPHLFGGSAVMRARDANTVVRDRIEKLKARAGRGS